MNVIFLDFDGVINTLFYGDDHIMHLNSSSDIENKIKILADICKEYNCKIVIEASVKSFIDEKTLVTDVEWVNNIFNLFEKYGIECIGRTPCVKRKLGDYSYLSMWKEDEIRLYLFRHPEIEHYCILDDDDLADMHRKSDLDKVRNHLVKTIYISKNKDELGLLERHKEEVGEVLKKENNIRRLVLKKRKTN